MATVPAVCVFCSSSLLIDERYSALAHDVGAAIARRGWTLVSGAGSISMMGAVARAARAGGGHTIGVIPDALVAMEVYDQSGNRILQRSWDNRSFTTNLRRRFAATWVVPAGLAPGTYTIKVGVFSPGWGTVYSWNDNAGTLKIK